MPESVAHAHQRRQGGHRRHLARRHRHRRLLAGVATDLENGTAEGFSPSCAAVEALEEGGPRSPHSEAGFRAWLDYYGGLSSEAIKAAVIAVQQKGEPA